PEDGLGHLDALLEWHRRVGEHPPDALVGDDARGHVELGPPCLEGVVARGHLEGGLRVATCGRFPTSHQFFESPTPDVFRNSSTRRRWRSSVIVSPRTLPAARRARSATSPRTSWIARVFSASISPAALTRRRSSSSRVAAMSASRVSWATFWARARISFDSR